MTQEQIKQLYTDAEEYLEIFNKNKPITNDGFDIELVKMTITQMVEKAVPDTQERNNLLAWMDTHDFFKTPASTKFHGNFESGLCVHSLQVTYQAFKFAKPVLEDYFSSPKATNINFTANDIFIACIAHDFCKSGSYEIQFRNTKDLFGNWVKKPYYKTKDDIRNLGHGNESVLQLVEAMPSIIKNRPVIEAISRHMGFSDLSESETYNYSNFLDNPLVLLLQLADQTAASWYNN